MKFIKILSIALFVGSSSLFAQDPHFTQFYSAPFTVNPAYTGVFEGSFRMMSNYRQQWNSLASPYTTALVALDAKIGNKKDVGQNPFNVGMQLMTDKSMKGAFMSNYASVVTSYHVPLDVDGYESLGAGLTFSYGQRKLDFSSLTFDSQFTSGGYDQTLPSGETALQDMKPFVSIGAGVLYQYRDADFGNYFDVGFSAYHVNQPKQTFLADDQQYLPIRFSGQISYQHYISENGIINLKGLYQNQGKVEYFLGGATYAKVLNQNKDMIGLGAYYRTGDAISPIVFFEFSDVQVGFSYDILNSNLKNAPKPLRSMEFSLQWRLGDR